MILERINNPQASVEPFKAQAREGVNSNFAGFEDVVRQKYGRAGRTGKSGRAAQMGESARLGQLSALEPQFAQMAQGGQNDALSLAERLLGQNFGTETQQSNVGSSSGTNILPGSVAGGALTGGLQMFATLQALQALMNGGGGGADGGYSRGGR